MVFLLMVTERVGCADQVGATELALDSVHCDTFFIFLLDTCYLSFISMPLNGVGL